MKTEEIVEEVLNLQKEIKSRGLQISQLNSLLSENEILHSKGTRLELWKMSIHHPDLYMVGEGVYLGCSSHVDHTGEVQTKHKIAKVLASGKESGKMWGSWEYSEIRVKS